MTWDSIAALYGVKRCAGCERPLDHIAGVASGNTVHWRDRRLTKPGLRHYLMHIATLRLVAIEEEWRRIYARNIWATGAARELHVRIPARYADNDRARVRWLISKQERVPSEVRRWARGRSI